MELKLIHFRRPASNGCRNSDRVGFAARILPAISGQKWPPRPGSGSRGSRRNTVQFILLTCLAAVGILRPDFETQIYEN
ncbi:MAG TPA: hypothetical protein VI454_01780 [Verrucomicrobiae bacterium]|jgi:hypothetical protein